jgi:hypothetical protein
MNITIVQSLSQQLSSLRVGQKIGLGYALALGIAVSGTIAGFGIGQHYQQQAAEQALLLAFTNSDLALEFDGISDDLVGLIEEAYRELKVAEELHNQAGNVAQKIVVASIGLSVAIAILLAILTSRAIAQPIQTLTRVAQRSTEESNFELQATIEQTVTTASTRTATHSDADGAKRKDVCFGANGSRGSPRNQQSGQLHPRQPEPRTGILP